MRTLAVAIVIGFSLTGCQALPADALVDNNGNTIRKVAITGILDDENLTETEKRQALRDLGITDEQLIDALVVGGVTAANQTTSGLDNGT